mmetsp:Transcript_52273/g.124688  ORF Transcript_52273/g.124688 Transcript_52273/m.124688 type:complete len:90 (+) Transcript_52273:1082-1351(+)
MLSQGAQGARKAERGSSGWIPGIPSTVARLNHVGGRGVVFWGVVSMAPCADSHLLKGATCLLRTTALPLAALTAATMHISFSRIVGLQT